MVPIVQEAEIWSLDHPARSKSDHKVSLGSRSVQACCQSWPAIGLSLQWLLASSWSCHLVGPGQDGPQTRTVAHEDHISAFCEVLCHSIRIWQLPWHTATSSTVNKELQLHSELILALTTLCLRQLCVVLVNLARESSGQYCKLQTDVWAVLEYTWILACYAEVLLL